MGGKVAANNRGRIAVSISEHSYLSTGLEHREGRLPLFDSHGQEVKLSVIRSCEAKGLIEGWFANPMRPNWRVYRLTEKGRRIAAMSPAEFTS